MRTVIATVTISESAELVSVTLTHDTDYETFVKPDTLTLMEFPWMGDEFYSDADHWKRDLGAWLIRLAKEQWQRLGGAQGEREVYVSPNCSTYVYELDFDS